MVRFVYALKRVFPVVFLATILAGCATQGPFATAEKLDRRAADLKIVLMPPDITLSELTVGGVNEVNAQWTTAAKTYSQEALQTFLQQRNTQLIAYKEPENADAEHMHEQLIKLHEAVGSSILLHQYFQPLQLPSKKDKFDWTMGGDVQALGRDEGADYALFVHITDSYASSARIATQVLMALVFHTAVQGGVQVGYASLVDLRTGEIVWFNRLQRGTGDLRKPEAARETIEVLMSKFPS